MGDVNQDGFPDLLAILAAGASMKDRVPRMALSVPCAHGVTGCHEDGSGRRGWKMLRKGAEILADIKDARSVAFLDMDEDVSGHQSIVRFLK